MQLGREWLVIQFLGLDVLGYSYCPPSCIHKKLLPAFPIPSFSHLPGRARKSVLLASLLRCLCSYMEGQEKVCSKRYLKRLSESLWNSSKDKSAPYFHSSVSFSYFIK